MIPMCFSWAKPCERSGGGSLARLTTGERSAPTPTPRRLRKQKSCGSWPGTGSQQRWPCMNSMSTWRSMPRRRSGGRAPLLRLASTAATLCFPTSQMFHLQQEKRQLGTLAKRRGSEKRRGPGSVIREGATSRTALSARDRARRHFLRLLLR